MSQKEIFSEKTRRRPCACRSSWTGIVFATALVAVACLPRIGNSQQPFNTEPNRQTTPPANQWAPAAPAFSAQRTSFDADLPQVHGDFPNAIVPFDPGVRTAHLETGMTPPNSLTPPDDPGSSVETTIDSTAIMLSNLKNTVGAKTSTWLESLNQSGGWSAKFNSLFGNSDTGRMLGSLALVLGLYFGFVWLTRKFNPQANQGLPPEVIEVIGQVPFGVKRNLQLVRLGSKLLLFLNSAEGTQPIGEISDPAEVEQLVSMCTRKRSSPRRESLARQATNRLSSFRASNSSQTSPDNQPRPTAAPNLAEVLKTLENAAKQGRAVFEA